MKDDCVFNHNFLDGAALAKTKGAWSVQKGSTRGNIAVIRNHEWPGYTMFHKINTKVHGGVYVGDGLKHTTLSWKL